MMEWLDIPGYEGVYRISDHGHILSFNYKKPRLMKDGPNGHLGHRCIKLRKNGTSRNQGVQGLVLLAFVGPPPEGMEARHLDGNPRNNYVGNLKYGTRKENAQDRIDHGRGAHGENNGRAKLTDMDVVEIRILRAKGHLQTTLAAKFGVTQTVISQIDLRKSWSHI